ncbi:hypothetical protein [Propionivibrio sp.]|uniref:hypothetical protein n=1 Tax=Propionivibrio sp. TaxID=2212460 RepID=UPI003BF3DE94
MATLLQAQLFSWVDVETCSDLDRLTLALDYLPDEPLMRALEVRRDYMKTMLASSSPCAVNAICSLALRNCSICSIPP